ncbi:hypothetical protein G3485_08855 [Shewanella baltica]|uniref:hypothetical protein n=1 Tax=Shewanella TaxID=22 RepID=UPI00217E0478|nr:MULTISPECIES: hypothetical protein [Shewanella]MCS6127108.1 hypothetical protein [Shewanella baltica]MCS6139092.1 hypothetical protein [Shewanella baltica]MCS6145232.1 hypothetical protein [Shewanella baltica]MCS6169762.1 hypothetical protein [Shewanella baltica]MCS6186986.1 hypothetical protein [Shewanella baltica]
MENMSNIGQEALIALPSLPSDRPHEIILLDSKWLAFHRGINGPITIAKTKFSIENGSSWTAIIVDGSNTLILACSDELGSNDSPINLIEVLGHRLVVMPWQSLIIQLDEPALMQGTCFIENTKQDL